ncbi:MAG: hypothetical protein HC782_00890 [Gammaproteobacteria bacterium]|nr:hypothetical protein [Gammaproteobacteria bacterium]
MASGCSVLQPEKRHSPAEIAAYTTADFLAPIASSAGELAARNAANSKIQEAISLPVGVDPNNILPGALWNIGFLNVEKAAGLQLVRNALPTLTEKDASYQRGILSAAYTHYAAETAPEIQTLLARIATPREFAIAAYTLQRADDSPAMREFILATMRNVFTNWQIEPRLIRLNQVLNADLRQVLANRPPLIDLLRHSYGAGKPVVFSFQRQDRQRFWSGSRAWRRWQFVRNADGTIFNVAHLAMPLPIARHHHQWQHAGRAFTIIGAGTATNKWIGPTPYLESQIPVEATLAAFAHSEDKNQNPWTDAAYEAFLPQSWRGYWPFKEALLAGQAGRNEMLLHGTTINSDYYRGASFYPGTPSAGCLVAMEYWSKDMVDCLKAIS